MQPPTTTNPAIEIRDAPSGGLGLFSKTPLKQGALVLQEPPTILVSTTHLPGPKTTWLQVMHEMRKGTLPPHHVTEAMNHLTQDQLDTFRASCTYARDDVHRFHIISFDICPVFGGPPSAFAATPDGLFLNHSCVGNLLYSWDEKSGTVHLRAVQDIPAGEQLCLCYFVDWGWLGSEARKGEMFRIYDFECGCPLCGGESGVVRKSDGLREVIRTLQARLEEFVLSRDRDAYAQGIFDDALRYIDLVEQEVGGVNLETGLPFRADVRLAAAYRLASKCMENAEDARELREKATEISRLAFGPDSPHVAMQDRLFEEWCTKGL
ncbi:hypothetical protein EG327_007696 [Venturia inaequalis]|uniref:SET domain-containing protein n=1 Tax=Venturia inaequalis TaxID=5025 RepID=A0A8H3UXW0_VENIN|nr:hypothetical protein EG327_007696 [Venturia inaequalis]